MRTKSLFIRVIKTMSSLPSEVVGVVATFLPPTTRFQKPLMLVNHTWFHGVIGQDGMKPKPQINWPFPALRERPSSAKLFSKRQFDTNTDLTRLVEELPDTQNLHLDCGDLTNKGVLQLSDLKHLKSLTLKNTHKVSHATKHLSKLEQLTSLKLFNCDQVCEWDFLGMLSRLTSLEVKYMEYLDEDVVFTCIGEHLQQLSRLTLCCCYLGDEAPLDHLAKLTQLTALDLSGNSFTDELPNHLSSSLSPSLTSLNISSCSDISDDGILTLATSLPQLRSLDISSLKLLTDIALEHVGNKMKQLTSLNIESNRTFTTDGMRHLTNLSGSLTSLNVRRNDTAMVGEAFQHVSTMEHLTELDVGDCRNITSEAVEHLSQINSLWVLRMSFAKLINPAHSTCLSTLGDALENLTELDLSYCNGIDDGNAFVHLGKFSSSLTSLDLTGATISDVGLEQVGKLEVLHSLIIDHCKCVTEAGFAHLSVLRNLRRFQAYGCRISDNSLEHFHCQTNGKFFVGLDELQLYRCDAITDGSVEILKQLENVVVLDLRATGISERGLEAIEDHLGVKMKSD